MKKEEIIKQKEEQGIKLVSDGGNKIEFSDGTTYARDFRTGEYRKAKIFIWEGKNEKR